MGSALSVLVPALVVALTTTGCDLLYPPPSEPDPEALALGAPEIEAAIFDPDLSCHQRMDALQDLWACRVKERATGDEVQCALEAPWARVGFGCGPGEVPLVPDPSAVFAERMRLVARPDTDAIAMLRARFQATFGDCAVFGAGPPVGEAERYPGDPGTRACFAPPLVRPDGGRLSSGMRRYPGGSVDYPMGIFLEADPDVAGADAFRTLIIDTDLLDEPERRAAIARFRDVLHF